MSERTIDRLIYILGPFALFGIFYPISLLPKVTKFTEQDLYIFLAIAIPSVARGVSEKLFQAIIAVYATAYIAFVALTLTALLFFRK